MIPPDITQRGFLLTTTIGRLGASVAAMGCALTWLLLLAANVPAAEPAADAGALTLCNLKAIESIRESGNHALAGIRHEGTDLNHTGAAGGAAGIVERPQPMSHLGTSFRRPIARKISFSNGCCFPSAHLTPA